MDYRSLCALCRAPLTAGQSVNVLIAGIISERYPRALRARKAEMEAELSAQEDDANAERRRAALSGGSILPLLRLPTMPFPHCRAEVELHREEDLRAVDYALQGGRRLGVLEAGGLPAGLGSCVEVE